MAETIPTIPGFGGQYRQGVKVQFVKKGLGARATEIDRKARELWDKGYRLSSDEVIAVSEALDAVVRKIMALKTVTPPPKDSSS